MDNGQQGECMKEKVKAEIKPEERNLPEIIEVFKANIKWYDHWPLAPKLCLTKGNMAYVIEILEQEISRKAEPS